jgi:hypothetical protein
MTNAQGEVNKLSRTLKSRACVCVMLAESVQADECINRSQIRFFRGLFGGDR